VTGLHSFSAPASLGSELLGNAGARKTLFDVDMTAHATNLKTLTNDQLVPLYYCSGDDYRKLAALTASYRGSDRGHFGTRF
jgi:hypothetical protein